MGGTELINLIEENIGTLITPVVSIAGSLMAAIHLRKKTSIETSAQEFEKIKAGHLKEAADELLKSGKMTYTEYYKMNNFLDIAKKADELWKERQTDEEEKTESKPYDFDWFMRFYDAVGTVSDDEMQRLWAKILAGEILQQGSYSLRTLETLRNLSKREAVLFRKICSYSISNGDRAFVPNYKEYLEFAQITFGEVLKLSEYGLILCDSFLGWKMEVEAKVKKVSNNNELIMLVRSKQKGEKGILEISQFPLTGTGEELRMVIGASASNESILRFGKLLKDEKGDKLNFSVNRIVSIRENEIEYDDTDLLDETENIQ